MGAKIRRLSAQTESAYLPLSGQKRKALLGIRISLPAAAAAPLHSSAAMRVMTATAHGPQDQPINCGGSFSTERCGFEEPRQPPLLARVEPWNYHLALQENEYRKQRKRQRFQADFLFTCANLADIRHPSGRKNSGNSLMKVKH